MSDCRRIERVDVYLVKEEEKSVHPLPEFNALVCEESAAEFIQENKIVDRSGNEQCRKEDQDGISDKNGGESGATISSRESDNWEIAEDDDEFKTPTSSENKIPSITECPPAPRKTRSSSRLMRKSLSDPIAPRLLFDESTEVEMFSGRLQNGGRQSRNLLETTVEGFVLRSRS